MTTPEHPHDPTAPGTGPTPDPGYFTTPTSPPTSYVPSPAPDVLGDLLPAQDAEPVRRRRTVLVAALAAATIGVAGVGIAAYATLSGGGAQPEDVLPADAIGFVKVDFDPGAGQKVAAYRLAKRFPTADEELGDEASFRDDVLRALVDDGDLGLDYARDVQPWIGDRAGLAVLAPTAEGGAPRAVVALAHDDRAAAEAALRKAREADAGGEAGGELAWAFTDDYVLLGTDQALLDASAGADRHLADVDRFDAAVDALGGDQLALAWLDAGSLADVLPALVLPALPVPGLSTEDLAELEEVEGSVVMGLRAESDAIELAVRTVDLSNGQDSLADSGVASGTGLLRELPEESIAALSFGLDPKGLETGYDAAIAQLEAVVPDLRSQIEQLGLDLPADLATVFGTELSAGAWGSVEAGPEVVVRTRTSDPAKARDVLEGLAETTGAAESGYDPQESIAVLDDGVAVGTPGALAELKAGGLGDRSDFRAAAPDAEDAVFVLFVSLRNALTAFGAEETPDTAPLEAVGLTAELDGNDAVVRLRLTLRG